MNKLTEKLNEELCEICGIKKRCCIDDGMIFDCVGRDSCEDCSKFTYPDFSDPENFAKLLEIISKKASVSFCFNGVYFGCSIHYVFKDIFEATEGNIAEVFLNTLLVQHHRNPSNPKLLELPEIKQAIKMVEWVL